MKNKILFAIAVAVMTLSGQGAFADGTNAVATDLNALILKINAKLEQGQVTEKDLTAELKEFDVLYARHKDAQPEDAVQILNMKAKVYLEVLNEPAEAAEAFQQIKHDRPETAQQVDAILDALKRPIEAEKIQRTLVVGAPFPAFDEKDLAGKILAVANYKGKVVLVDFWATWCVPCRMELPNVLKAYKDYHAKGFEIVGVSLDEDQPALERFIKENDMAWPEYYDGKRYENKLAMKYGIMSIPSNYLLDGDGKIIGANLRGDELGAAVAKALAKK
jgi:thiol-disulfide isomerase/thioredoxin